MTLKKGTVSNIAFGGDGVIRDEGKVVFTPFVLPGELVEFEITQAKKTHAFGRLIQVLTEHPQRIQPKCEYYGRCGGCQLQHASYELQLKIKQQFVQDAFTRIGKLSDVQIEPIIGTDKQWAYRRRIRLHERNGKTGFIGVDGHSLVEITHCEIFSGASLDMDDDIFVQAHPEQSEKLYRDIEAAVEQLCSENTSMRLLDLYCGTGILTARLAEFGKVTAVELNAKAIAWAKKHHPENIDWQIADVAKVCASTLKREQPDIVLINPPRTGLHREVVEALCERPAKHVFYTSCMPATLARDLKILCEAGYQIVKCQPYDLFPQTTHVETVVQLCFR
ncbi:MAG: methyltransferase [Myxococcota bacterium]